MNITQVDPESGKDQEVGFHVEMKRTVLNSAQVKEVVQDGADKFIPPQSYFVRTETMGNDLIMIFIIVLMD